MNSTTLAFVTAVQKRAGFWEMLIPIFMQLFQALMEQCANNEDEAVEMMTNPSPAQMRIMHRRMLLKIHAKCADEKAKAKKAGLAFDDPIPLGERNASAWQAVYAGIEEASENPDAIRATFRESRATQAA